MPNLPEPMATPSTSPPERKSWLSWLFEPCAGARVGCLPDGKAMKTNRQGEES